MNEEKGCCSSQGLTKMSSPSVFRVGESAFLLPLNTLSSFQRGYKYTPQVSLQLEQSALLATPSKS